MSRNPALPCPSLPSCGMLLLALLAAGVTLTARSSQAEPPAGKAVMLTDDDWRQASRQPITSAEIDALVNQELQARRLEPAPLTTDEQFLRRASLDLTGQLPPPATIRAFVASEDPAKRAQLVDQLLDSDDHARHWARFWRDVVSVRITNRRSMGLTRSFEEWLFEQFRDEQSWGDITRRIVTAQGELRFTLNTPTAENGQLFFLVAHDSDEAEERAAETSRVFLGIQIQCAQCHDHPSEPWNRIQFHEMAAYFSRIKYEQLFDDKKLAGVQLVVTPDREHQMVSLEDPDSFTLTHPRFLDGQAPGVNLDDQHRRESLADLIVDPENHWFAAAYVNRITAELLGQPFYPHVDDLGPRKEVVFPALLTRMTGSFRGTNYDMKALFRAILNSQTYQRQIRPGDPAGQPAYFAAAVTKRLRPDTQWDSLVHVLGKIEHGARFHTGSGRRFNLSFLEGRFRTEFDFDPSLDEVEVQGTIPQTLLMMNNLKLHQRVAIGHTTLLKQVLKDFAEDGPAVEHLYLLALARQPTDQERARCSDYLAAAPTREEAFEDLLWALVNSTEFQTRR
ncbi:DUF1549 domain-containing protein [Lignipirellula cremea]|uniref:DUF1549 domain-containing protein n=1 Tax=Lignipirellula cremea TaxID=2528010 RepID=A0A518E4M9_9BACT|nr:DUF1549 domain-containing protein [Lignipirellula cremea]QDU99050.1 hypothetical protein Pla8534_69610 [Lignipirellula cremea]